MPDSNSAWSLDKASTFTSTSIRDGVGMVYALIFDVHTIVFALVDELVEFRVVHDRLARVLENARNCHDKY